MKIKHDVVLCGTKYTRGTEVEVLDASDPFIQAIFPGIKNNPESPLTAVRFPGRNHATVCLGKSLE